MAQTLGAGLFWNTMVIMAKVKTLWSLGMKVLPSMMCLFETFQPAIGSLRERQVLDGLYGQMPVRNVSFDLLEQVPHKRQPLKSTM
jgi:mannose-1-phosphate guanylyltransferase